MFLGFRREHVPWNFKKTENHVYLHVVLWQKLDADESEPAEEATLLTIGMTDLSLLRSCMYHLLLWRAYGLCE